MIHISVFVLGFLTGVVLERLLGTKSYFLSGAANGLGWCGAVFLYGFSARGVAGMFLFSLAFVIAIIDLRNYIIPNILVLLFWFSGLVYHLLARDMAFIDCATGMLAGFLVPLFIALVSRGGIGGGDVKLLGAMGLWLGFPAVIGILFLGALAGGIYGCLLLVVGKKRFKDPIPFGPFLSAAFLFGFFFPQYFIAW